MKRTYLGWGFVLLLHGLLAFGLGPGGREGGRENSGAARAETAASSPTKEGQESQKATGGELRLLDRGKPVGACPLKHTDVQTQVSGYVARTRVRQTFTNPLDRKIEAVYIFPLPQESAVDEMVMTVGQRRIVGKVKPREQARKVYETAKRAGHVASLLDQERPNIFTQAVANIEPGATIDIEIAYVETLKFDDGVYELVFPMVVGPRYIPGEPSGRTGTGVAADTGRVPDASRITPGAFPPQMRAGHDISLSVRLDPGTELFDIRCPSHEVDIQRPDPSHAVVSLKDRATLPNKDFILRYRTVKDEVTDALLVHEDPRGRFFTLVLQPPRRVTPRQARPREMIFVIDRSGSMEGFPIEKAKDTMRLCIEKMGPDDTFNLLSFSGGMGRCFERPVRNTPANRERARRYLGDLTGSGGTEMMPAVLAALEGRRDPERLRVVCFMTDGYVGNDFEIIAAVRKNAGVARVFSFGIGSSVNRFLLDGMAHAGRGEVEYVTLDSEADAAVRRFQERIQAPVLTDIRLDWGELQVSDVFPAAIPDLFSVGPLMVHGRLRGEPRGTLTLRGRTARGAFERKVRIAPAAAERSHEALPALWARAHVKHLMQQDPAGLQNGSFPDPLKARITQLGVEYRLVTQFTSFVAVEEQRKTPGGDPARVGVPVETPEGVNPYTAGGLLAAQTGDPLIRVEAPVDALHVVAVMPDGEVKRLAYVPSSRGWEVRFDIPTYAAEGEYIVRVIIVPRSGPRRVIAVKYGVDLTAPAGVGGVRRLGPAGEMASLQVEAGADAARVAALLPWGEKVLLAPSGDRFGARVTVPAAYRGQPWAVTYVITDRAHNRTTITVDMRETNP